MELKEQSNQSAAVGTSLQLEHFAGWDHYPKYTNVTVTKKTKRQHPLSLSNSLNTINYEISVVL